MRPLRKNRLFSKFTKFLQKDEKFLILVEKRELVKFEREKGIYLGSESSFNKVRPALLIISANEEQIYFKLLFLTASKIGQIAIDLNLCPQKTKLCSKFPFYPRSYLFAERRLGYFCIKLKTMELLEKVHYCGRCENLEELEKIPLVEL